MALKGLSESFEARAIWLTPLVVRSHAMSNATNRKTRIDKHFVAPGND